MAGVFPIDLVMHEKPVGHGYTSAIIDYANPYFSKGENISGHEFHYSELTRAPAPELETVYHVTDRKHVKNTAEGYQFKNTIGSYIHLHFRSNPGIAGAFVHACENFKQSKTHKE